MSAVADYAPPQHANAARILTALREMFPMVELFAKESHYGNVLTIVMVDAEGSRFGYRTSLTRDYRQLDYREVVHGTAENIRERLAS